MSIAENGVGEEIRAEDRHGDSQDLAVIKEQTFESLHPEKPAFAADAERG